MVHVGFLVSMTPPQVRRKGHGKQVGSGIQIDRASLGPCSGQGHCAFFFLVKTLHFLSVSLHSQVYKWALGDCYGNLPKYFTCDIYPPRNNYSPTPNKRSPTKRPPTKRSPTKRPVIKVLRRAHLLFLSLSSGHIHFPEGGRLLRVELFKIPYGVGLFAQDMYESAPCQTI